MLTGLFHGKDVEDLLDAADGSNTGLKRTLGAFDLTLLGVGAIVGAGIFATIGTAAAGNMSRPGAGPSLIISFLITAVVCAFTALCYAELASTVPISGSAYTYAYATLGELAAWVIGWDLVLEYTISTVAVAISWSNYFRVFLHDIGLQVPLWLATDMRTARLIPGFLDSAPHILGVPIVFNALAFGIVFVLMLVTIWGIRESSRFNAIMVMLKVLILLLFVGIAVYFVPHATMVANWQPFFPNGFKGTLTGAAIVFFAYVGFDSVSAVTEETRAPGRNVPLGIIASLVVCAVLYLIVTATFTGIISFPDLLAQGPNQQGEPLTMALQHVAPHLTWASILVAAGAVIAQTTALLVYQIAQPRILFAMARDGLLPACFTKLHKRYKTPYVAIILTSLSIGIMAAVASIDEMVDLCNIGTLFAFVVVCIGVPIMHHHDPQRPRPFRVPFGPYIIPALGASSCLFLMWYLPPASWWRFWGWLIAGLAVYALLGYSQSVMGRKLGRASQATLTHKVTGFALLVIAIGMFTLPHDAGVLYVMHATISADVAAHQRSVVGVGLIMVGLLLMIAVVGSIKARRIHDKH